MKKLRRMGLVCLTVLAMILPVCPASAATIEDQSKVIFYQNGKVVAKDAIAAGEVTAKVRVASETLDQNQGFKIILAAYNSNKTELKDVSYQSESLEKMNSTESPSVTAPAERSFTVGPVTVPAGGSAEVYIWNNDLTPEGEGVGIVNRGTYCLSGIKLGSYTTAVDQIGKRILVNTKENVTGAAISNVKAPAGYTCAWSGDAIVLTAPDGTAVTYPVLKTDAFSAYDFEGRSGALSTTVKTEWFNDSRNLTEGDKVTVTYAKDPLDGNNDVIQLTDGSSQKSAWARLNVAKSYPYVISYKVMYAEPNEGDDIGYSFMGLIEGTNWQVMAGASAASINADGEARKFGFAIEKKNAYAETTKLHFDLNTWHEASIAFIDENTVKYYFDGKEAATYKPETALDLNHIVFRTNDKRTCTVYLDDVMIRDYYLQKAELSSASFKDAAGNPVAGFMHDGTVYANRANLTGLTLDQVSVSDGATAALSGSQITVTSADGLVKNYPVVAKTFFSDNFDSYAEGAALTTSETGPYKSASNAGLADAVLVAKDGGNNILRTKNTTTSGQFTYVQILIPDRSKSFVAQYRVRYGLLDGTSFDAANKNCPFYSYVGGAGDQYYGLQPISGTNKDAIDLQYTAKTKGTKKGAIALNQWYTMKIVYQVTADTDGNEAAAVTYYLDGELLGEENMAAEVSPNAFIEIRDSKRNHIVDYDDITILPL